MLRVLITGYPGEGKSTVAQELEELLFAYGMKVENRDSDPRASGELRQHRLGSMRGREVVIETIDVRPGPVAGEG